LYLDPEAALTAIQPVGQATGGSIGVTPRTLAKRLHERGFLLSINAKQGELKVRHTLEGRRRHVLHLAASTITLEESSQSGQSHQSATASQADRAFSRGHGRIRRPDADSAEQESSQEILSNSAEPLGSGRGGRIAGILEGGGERRLDCTEPTSSPDCDSAAEVHEWAATL
jgi:hypothetical protein